MATDYYELLGVSRSATQDEIKRAYRRRARELHPDVNKSEDAESQFKEVSKAYETLSDPNRRNRYDQFGPEGMAGGGGGDPFGGSGLGDIFDAFFGGQSPFGGGGSARGPAGPPRGVDIEARVDLEFEDAVFGSKAEVKVRTAVACEECEATGAAPGTSPDTCPECNGVGQVRRVRQSILGQMVTSGPCGRCGGMGKVIAEKCPRCDGEGREITDKTFTIDVPAGVDSGTTLRLPGKGAVGPLGGGAGDLYVQIRVRPHEYLRREQDDLVHTLPISATQAALGTHITYETLDGSEDLVIPKGTQTGRVFTLRGRGVPHVQARGRGDLRVEVVVETPTGMSREEEDLLRQLAELRGEDVAPADDGLFARIRSAFK